MASADTAFDWSPAHKLQRAAFRAFVDSAIAPHAAGYEASEQLPALELAARFGAHGWLAGETLDPLAFALLHQAVGAASGSVRSLLTVQSMVATAIARCGTPAQRERWLGPLHAGTAIAGFALTEPDAGSDTTALACSATPTDQGFVLAGRKSWVSFAQCANVLLVIARIDTQPTAFLVDAETPGITVEPIRGLTGLRAVMGGSVMFDQCQVPAHARLGGPGLGFSLVAQTALDVGRFSVACGAAGAAAACLNVALQHVRTRRQFGKPLIDHPGLRPRLARMLVATRSAALFCARAAAARAAKDDSAIAETVLAKYHATQCLSQVAADAVHLLGASGCARDALVARHHADASLLEIIEGTTEIQELLIAQALASGYDGLL